MDAGCVVWQGLLHHKDSLNGELFREEFQVCFCILLDSNRFELYTHADGESASAPAAYAELKAAGWTKKGSIDTQTIASLHDNKASASAVEILTPGRVDVVYPAEGVGGMDKLLSSMRDPVTLKGWLKKMGGVNKSWKRRWFVLLRSGKMHYYPAAEDWPNAKPTGTIDLNTSADIRAKTTKESPVTLWLEVDTPSRTWCLKADEDDAGAGAGPAADSRPLRDKTSVWGSAEQVNKVWLNRMVAFGPRPLEASAARRAMDQGQVEAVASAMTARAPFQMLVTGPPLSGKTTLCKKVENSVGQKSLPAARCPLLALQTGAPASVQC
jgi:hypothetical protein